LKKSIGICKNESRASPPARSGSVAGPRDLADSRFEYFCGFQNSIGLFVETFTGRFLCPIYFSKIVLFGAGLGPGGRAPGPGRARVCSPPSAGDCFFIACMPDRASRHNFRVMVNGLYDIYFSMASRSENEGPRQPRFWYSPQRNQELQPGNKIICS